MHHGKKIIANFLLILFMSVQCAFNLNVWRLIQHHILEKETEHALIVLRFTADQWQQTQKHGDDEVKIGNQMFDIKSVKVVGNEVMVCGHFDHEEDEILADTHESQKKDATKKTDKHQQLLFFEQVPESENAMRTLTPSEYQLALSADYHFPYHDIDSPPPQV